jgi:hypothetical protein
MIKSSAMRAFSISLIFFLCACSANFYARRAVNVENALRVGNEAWDERYNEKLEECKEVAEPKTPEAEECFGPTFDKNKNVGIAMKSSVAILRAFWIGYAAGKDPKELREILSELPKVIQDLPDEIFAGIKKGLK